MNHVRFVFTLTLAFFALSSAGGEPAKSVEEVLQLSGVTGGLCAWLEPGKGDGVVDLARGGKFLVHGIVSDAKEAAALRQRLAGAGLSGFTSIETLPLKVLPHADNLVNLFVADDLPALTAKGLALAEVLRALAPNGVACF